MSLLTRLRRVERAVAALPPPRTSLYDKPLKEVREAVRAAVSPQSAPVLDEILRQEAQCLASKGLRHHGFTSWLNDLSDGSSLLPRVIPHDVLLAWRNGHAEEPTQSPHADVYCPRCAMRLPKVGPTGYESSRFRKCPVCGCDDLGWENPYQPGRWRSQRRNRYTPRVIEMSPI
jgi:hypothetical protein